MDIPEREQSQGTKKQPFPMPEPQEVKVVPFGIPIGSRQNDLAILD